MTKTRWTGVMLIALNIPAGNLQARAQEATQLYAKVVRLTGAAHYSVGGKVWQTLKAGDALPPGTLVQTARTKSTVDIQLGEGTGSNANLLRLYDDSAVEIRTLAVRGTGADRVEEIELDLRAGQVLGVVKKFKPGAAYRVVLPSGAAGIHTDSNDGKGTAYVLKTSGALTVLAGKVAIAIASENTSAQVVEAEQQFDPATGKVDKLPASAPERKLWR